MTQMVMERLVETKHQNACSSSSIAWTPTVMVSSRKPRSTRDVVSAKLVAVEAASVVLVAVEVAAASS